MKTRKRQKIDVSEDSLQYLMQEVYTEIVDERNKAMTAYKKFSKEINDSTDISMIGKITNDLLKIADSAIDKKLKLIKLQSDILYKGEKNTSDSIQNNGKITAEDKKWLRDQMEKQRNDGFDVDDKIYN